MRPLVFKPEHRAEPPEGPVHTQIGGAPLPVAESGAGVEPAALHDADLPSRASQIPREMCAVLWNRLEF